MCDRFCYKVTLVRGRKDFGGLNTEWPFAFAHRLKSLIRTFHANLLQIPLQTKPRPCTREGSQGNLPILSMRDDCGQQRPGRLKIRTSGADIRKPSHPGGIKEWDGGLAQHGKPASITTDRFERNGQQSP